MTAPKPKHLLQKVGRKPLLPEQRKTWTLPMLQACCRVTLTGCWEWCGASGRKPPNSEHLRCHPTVEHAGERLLVRRLAWKLVHGKDAAPDKLIAAVKCGNLRCQNPFHCKPVTEAEKSRLAAQRGSFATPHRCRACAEGKRAHTTTGMTLEKARRIRETKGPAHEHCKAYGISPGMFNRIRSGKAWREYA